MRNLCEGLTDIDNVAVMMTGRQIEPHVLFQTAVVGGEGIGVSARGLRVEKFFHFMASRFDYATSSGLAAIQDGASHVVVEKFGFDGRHMVHSFGRRDHCARERRNCLVLRGVRRRVPVVSFHSES